MLTRQIACFYVHNFSRKNRPGYFREGVRQVHERFLRSALQRRNIRWVQVLRLRSRRASAIRKNFCHLDSLSLVALMLPRGQAEVTGSWAHVRAAECMRIKRRRQADNRNLVRLSEESV